jgi:SAM-dependent methyltransferase
MQQKISPDLSIEISSDPWSRWVASPMGSYLLRWEQAQLDTAVSDVFGFHAIQLGFAELSGLRNNRMADRILIVRPGDSTPSDVTMTESFGSRMLLEFFEDLPFADSSVDLLVLPHVLERAGDPHQVLREVARVLRPEGRVIITGFNPVSLWGARDIFLRPFGRPLIPIEHKSISLPRLRDWLGLLSFDLDQTRYGCYAPPFRKQKTLDRSAFLESIGDRFWPICGSAYLLCAVKRVRAMRLLGPAWKNEAHRRNAAVVASPRFEGGGASAPPAQCEKPDKT